MILILFSEDISSKVKMLKDISVTFCNQNILYQMNKQITSMIDNSSEEIYKRAENLTVAIVRNNNIENRNYN